jgi:zinc transport system substrate-binding protein
VVGVLVRHVVAAAAVVALLGACGPPRPAGNGRLRVVASFYPLQFVAERVGGERVAVTNLVKPGAEPHDLELTPWQAVEVADADLVVYLSGFQPAVDDAVDQSARDHALDVTKTIATLTGSVEGSGHGADPHMWQDPVRLAAIARATADRLAALDPSSAAAYHARAAAIGTQLTQLDQEFTAGLASCQRRTIVTSHAAFGYLADRYHLRQIAITGVTPEDEPTPKHLKQAVDLARSTGTTTIFFETLLTAKIAEAVATEVGAKAAVLDPIEGVQAGSGADYFSLMRANLASLRTALGCT